MMSSGPSTMVNALKGKQGIPFCLVFLPSLKVAVKSAEGLVFSDVVLLILKSV